MRNHRGQIPVMRERAGNSLRQQGIWTPPFPFPLRGKAGAGGFPPRREHVARPAKGAGTHRAPAPPTRGLPPPCASPAQRAGAGFMHCRDSAGLKRRTDFGRAVYTEYLTLPSSPISSSRQAGHGNHRGSPIARFGPEDKGVYTKTGRPEMNQYTVFFAQTTTGYSAHV